MDDVEDKLPPDTSSKFAEEKSLSENVEDKIPSQSSSNIALETPLAEHFEFKVPSEPSSTIAAVETPQADHVEDKIPSESTSNIALETPLVEHIEDKLPSESSSTIAFVEIPQADQVEDKLPCESSSKISVETPLAEHGEDKLSSMPSFKFPVVMPLAEPSEENSEVVNLADNPFSIEAPINPLSNGKVEPDTHLPVNELSESAESPNSASIPTTVDVTESSYQVALVEDSVPIAAEDVSYNHEMKDDVTDVSAADNEIRLSASSSETKDLQNNHNEVNIDEGTIVLPL